MSEQASDERIQPALDALLVGDADALRAVLRADPGLVNLAWQGSTLLEWATQPPHGIDPATIDVLIDCGAELDRALNLAACWNQADLCRKLLADGADPSARADAGITPLESAAMHGARDAADALVAHGLHRRSFWLAAATGRLDLVRQWVSPSGDLLDDPGPYRPCWADVGRPPGADPTGDSAGIVGEALVFAAANDRRDVIDYLLAAGADIDARPYRNTTGLHLAVQFGKVDSVRHLLACGASTAIRDDEHHSDAAGWAAACDDGSVTTQAIVRMLQEHRGPGDAG